MLAGSVMRPTLTSESIKRERLHRLLRVEVVPRGLVREVQAGTNHGDIANRAWLQQTALTQLHQRLFQRKVGPEGRVERQPAIAKQLRTSGKLVAGVGGLTDSLYLAGQFGSLGDDALNELVDVCEQAGAICRGSRLVSLFDEQLLCEQPPLILSRYSQRRHEIRRTARNQLCALRIVHCRRAGCIQLHARELCKRRAEQQPVDDGLFVAALQTAPNRLVLPLNPFGPRALRSGRVSGLEFWREDIGQRREGVTHLGVRREPRLGMNRGGKEHCQGGEEDHASSHADR